MISKKVKANVDMLTDFTFLMEVEVDYQKVNAP